MPRNRSDVGIRVVKGNSAFFIRMVNDSAAWSFARALVKSANEPLTVQVIQHNRVSVQFRSEAETISYR
jgi:hypothetical protein